MSAVHGVDSQRQRGGWILLAAVGCFVALATPFFAQQVYVADDLGAFHLPVRDFYSRQLNSGEPFDWMPSLYGGFYVSAEGQLGGYHPWHWLLYRTLPLGAAFDIELLSSYPFLFAGTYLFFRRLVRRRDAALFGALAFTFGGFCLLHFLHPNAIAVVAHLPWLLWAIDVALTTSSRPAQVGAQWAICLLTASQLLLGYPQYVWLSLLAEAAFVAWRIGSGEARRRALLWIVFAVGCGGLIGAAQWIPTWHLLHESVRHAPDTEFANTGSMHLLNLAQLLAPYLFDTRVVGQNTHELGLYVGAVPIVLCVWLLAMRREWGVYRSLILGLLVCTLLATLLAAGEFGGLYRLQAWVPLANRFRFPCRAIVLVQLCLTALAAVGAALLFARQDEGETANRSGSRALLWLVLFSMGLAIVGPLAWPAHVARWPLVWAGPLLIAVAALVVRSAERGLPGAVVLMAVLTAADLGIYGLSYSVYGRTADLNDYVASTNLPPGDRTPARVAAPISIGETRTGDRMLLAGVSRVDGYAGLEPAKRLDYSKQATLQLAGVAWILEPSHQSECEESRWTPLSPTAPRARLVTSIGQQLTASGMSQWNVLETEPPQELHYGKPGAVQILEDRPGRFVIDTQTDGRQLLVTTESFDSLWTATVDGQAVPVVRVDGDFLGCVVPEGKHRVRLEFCPRPRQLGALVSCLGLGLLIFATCIRLASPRCTTAA